MTYIFRISSLILSLLISMNTYAVNQTEINHLLSYVEKTPCRYGRNGDMYTGIEALAHIQKKYHYFIDDIKTTEDFIKYSATKSKMSGKFYHIQCLGQPKVKSKDWLLTELKRFRANPE